MSTHSAGTKAPTETIVLGWSGLDAGINYLGAVGYDDDDGLFDLTLVEVSTG